MVDAPRLVNSLASPTRPECAVTRRSTPATCAAAVNRNPIICADNGQTVFFNDIVDRAVDFWSKFFDDNGITP